MIISNWVTVNSFFYVLCFLQKLRKDPLPCEKNNLNLCLYINTEPVKAATDQTGIHVWILSTFIYIWPRTRHIEMSMVSEYVYEYVYRCICSSRDWLGILCRDSEKFRQSDNIILRLWHVKIRKLFTARRQGGVSHPMYLSVMWQAIIFCPWNTVSDCRNSCRVCPALVNCRGSVYTDIYCILYTRICIV